jgi:hypothetical protein
VRGLTVAVVTLGGVLLSQVWPATAILAVVACFVAFVLLLVATIQQPHIVSLRHAAIGAGASALIAGIIGYLVFAVDPSLSVRVLLRSVILAAVTAPALYWLLLWLGDGFKERS